MPASHLRFIESRFMHDASQHTGFSDILLGFLSFILAFPLFILAHRQVPDMEWPYYADRIVLFIVIVFLLLFILRLFKPIITIGFLAIIGWLAYGSLADQYGFEEVYKDYRAMFYSMKNDPSPERIIFSGNPRAVRQNHILSSIDYNNPVVRNFAVSSTNKFFRTEQQKNEDYRRTIQCFAIFKRINSNWNYVNDPASREYYAKGSESVSLLAGDCDDYSILMASCIKAIGGTSRLIITTDHIYPELQIGNKKDLERVNFLIKKQLFPAASSGQDIFYHQDKDGTIWLNLDYTAKYPGGQFLAEPVLEILFP